MIQSINSGSTDWYSRKRNQMVDAILSAATSSVTKTAATNADTQSLEATEASTTLATSRTSTSLEDSMRRMQRGKMLPPPPKQEEVSEQDATSASTLSNTSTLSDIDADGDGTLSTDEYETLMSQLGIEDSLSSDEFFTKYDSDSNGEITKAEMDAARPPMGPPPRRTVTDELPTDIDTDGDGSLSADEYEAMISNLTIEEALTSEEFFTQYDTDQDGEITAAELNAYTAKAFSAYESNYQFTSEEDEANLNSIA